MSNYTRNVFYIGVTGDLWLRVLQHKRGYGCTFSSKYNTKYLVYFEEFDYIEDAIDREKQLKVWKRQWKIELIKEENREMIDLSDDWYTIDDIKDFLDSKSSLE
jgi:putative endonuclease